MTIRKYTINAYQVGLLFEKGKYIRLLEAGTYWLFNKEVIIYDLIYPFTPTVDWSVVLKQDELMQRLQVVDVKESELLLVFTDGKLTNVHTAGKYAYWKFFRDYHLLKVNISGIDIEAAIEPVLFEKEPLKPFIRTVTVESYEKALLLVDGKLTKLLEPGSYYFWKNPINIQVAKVDLRNQQMEISGQEMLTRDKANLRINASLQFQITDPVKAVLGNKEYEKILYAAGQLALRSLVGRFTLDELLERKEGLGNIILEWMAATALELGVVIKDAGIKDIVLPGEIKAIMNQVLMAEKKAQANIITRREETASTRSLLNTAKLMEDNTMLFKLKEMEFVEKVTDKISTLQISNNGSLSEQLKQIFVSSKT